HPDRHPFPSRRSSDLLGRAKNVELTHIGYKGGAPALQDVMGGQIASNICAVGEAFPYLQSGKLRAIGTFGTERDEFAPEAPTMVDRKSTRLNSSHVKI